jgi:cytochrome c oxidase subunit I
MATIAPPRRTRRPRTTKEYSGLWELAHDRRSQEDRQLYLYTALFFFISGRRRGAIIRAQLAKPERTWCRAEMYNQLFTMHGTTMVFLAVMPLSAAFFNFLIPLQIGARDVAFPRLNAFSLLGVPARRHLHHAADPVPGGAGRRLVRLRAADHAAVLARDQHRLLGAGPADPRHLLAGGGFNFITTIINMRAPGMTLMRMPMFTWMSFVVQFLMSWPSR